MEGEMLEMFGVSWRCLGSARDLWGQLEMLELFGVRWRCLGLSGDVWGQVEMFGVSWRCWVWLETLGLDGNGGWMEMVDG